MSRTIYINFTHARKLHAQTHSPQVPLTPQSVDSAAIAIVIR